MIEETELDRTPQEISGELEAILIMATEALSVEELAHAVSAEESVVREALEALSEFY